MSSDKFDPEQFHDKYKEDVLAMIEARANGEEIEAPEVHRPAATNVVNLMDVLQRSIEQSKARKKGRAADDDEADAEEKPAKRGATASKAKKSSTSTAKPKRKKTAA